MIFKKQYFLLLFLCKYFITVYTHLITTYAHSVASVGQIGVVGYKMGVFLYLSNAIIYNPNQIPYLGRGVYFPTLKIIFANTHKTFIRICF